ncbi:MAG: hypothetical protein HY739_01190 [Desulfobacterales bacterium]|nr:hypothetical protein [Desulfobacterales bacterium]
MKKVKDNSRNYRCIGQQNVSGNALRNFQNLFKRYQSRTSNCLKRTLGILPSISKRLASFGPLELESITGHLPLRVAKTTFGFGSALMTNMNECSKKWANQWVKRMLKNAPLTLDDI